MEIIKKAKVALNYALRINLEKVIRFEVYRKKDNRFFRFIVYDGKNYEELCTYLRHGTPDIYIAPEKTLIVGALYNIDGKQRFRAVDRSDMDRILAMNNYIIINGKMNCLTFNYDIAKWLFSNYHNIKIKFLPEILYHKVAKTYSSLEEFEQLNQAASKNSDKIWLLSNSCKDLRIDVDAIPEEILKTYIESNDYYQQYEIFDENGLKGLRVYSLSDKVLLEPEFQDILLENYRAYIQNATGLWAEYNLTIHKFVSNYEYEKIEIDAEKGFVTAIKNGEKILLHGPTDDNAPVIVRENNLYGLKLNGKPLVDSIYDNITPYENGYQVFKDGKYGILDINGATVLDCVYDNILIKNPLSPLYQVCKDNLWGVVSTSKIYVEFCDEKPDDKKYEAAVNAFINKRYKNQKTMVTTFLSINEETGGVLLKIRSFDRIFEVKKEAFPARVYHSILSRYVESLKLLRNSAIRVNKEGEIEYSYYESVAWKEIEKMNIGDIYSGTVQKLTPWGAIVRLKSGTCIKIENDSLPIKKGDLVTCKLTYKRMKKVCFEYMGTGEN